jgi:CDP-diglyceride synthetase
VQPLLIAQLLALLLIANGVPIIAKRLLGKAFAFPLDGGKPFVDGRPLFGASKTWRGVVLSILATTALAPLIGLAWEVGALTGAMAMLGDLLSSFIKRRLGLAPSSQAIILDQLPESLLPLLAACLVLPLTLVDLVVAATLFFVIERALSRLLFKLGLREQSF